MSYEVKDNSGSLFRNEKKESDKHPDYQGSCLIDGTEFWMSAWLKTADSGKKWMSFAFKPKEDKPPQQDKRTLSQRKAPPSFDDDPF